MRNRSAAAALSAVIAASSILCAWSLTSRAGRAMPLPVVPTDHGRLDDGVPLTAWLLFESCPFGDTEPGGPSNAGGNVDLDWLRRFGATETTLSERTVETLAGDTRSRLFHLLHRGSATPDFRAGLFQAESDSVNPNGFFTTSDPVVYYAACLVDSPAKQTAALFVHANDGMKLWVNNVPALRIEPAGGQLVTKYAERMALVHLDPGRNLLLAKVTRRAPDRAFAARLVSLTRAHRLWAENGLSALLDTHLVNPGASLKLTYPLCDPVCPVALDILDCSGKPVRSERFGLAGSRTVSLGGLRPGIYTARLATPFGSHAELFCIGDLEAQIVSTRRRLALASLPDAVRMHTDAWLYRVRHLCKPEHKHIADWSWQERIYSALGNIEAVLADPARGMTVLHAPGYQIRAYRSPLDGQLQYYNLIVPHRALAHGAMPLMVLSPPKFLPSRPFLEGKIVAHIEEVNRYVAMAEAYGYVVAMPGARGNAPNEEIRESDLLSVIDDVEHWYPIDRERIYGYGVCDGGALVFTFGAHHPSLFAALGSLAPAVGNGIPDMFPAPSPIGLTKNLTTVPLFVMHSVGDTSIPFTNSVDFVTSCRANGLDATLKLMSGGTHSVTVEDTDEMWWAFTRGRKRAAKPASVTLAASRLKFGQAFWARIVQFADPREPAQLSAWIDGPTHVSVETDNVAAFELRRDQMPVRSSDTLTVVTNGRAARLTVGRAGAVQVAESGGAPPERYHSPRAGSPPEGPIAHAFAEPFLLVVGTGGSEADRAALRRTAEGLRAAWRGEFYVDCRCKTDREVTAADMIAYNLVLIGGSGENVVLRSMADRLPLRFGRDRLVVAGHRCTGSNLTAEALFRNPNNPDRSLVVLAGTPHSRCELPDSHPWNTARSDLAVFRRDGAEAELGP